MGGEFNKKFRKSDKYKEDLPEEKIKSLSKILGKFFESEAEDYKKQQAIASPPDYEALQKKTAKGNMDFSLKSAIIEINRDADRRYQFATMKIRTQERQGKKFPQSSPLLEKWGIVNNNTEAHEKVKATFEFMKVVAEEPDCPPEAKKYIEEWLKEGVPAMGENFELLIPQVPMQQIAFMRQIIKEGLEEMVEKDGEEQAQKWADENLKKLEADVMKRIIDNYVAARDEVQQDADNLKKWFRSQKEMPGKTKADVLKDLWAELPKYSEAFDDWNAEYEKARETSIEEMKQWSKQEQARIDNDVEGQERIKKVLEEARR